MVDRRKESLATKFSTRAVKTHCFVIKEDVMNELYCPHKKSMNYRHLGVVKSQDKENDRQRRLLPAQLAICGDDSKRRNLRYSVQSLLLG
jgi:hypothetical protein